MTSGPLPSYDLPPFQYCLSYDALFFSQHILEGAFPQIHNTIVIDQHSRYSRYCTHGVSICTVWLALH